MSAARTCAHDGLPVAGEWFAVEEVADGVWSISEPHLHPMIRANAYLVHGAERDLLVDAGNGLASIRTELRRRGLLRREVIAVATHTHFDHIGGMHEFPARLVHRTEEHGLTAPEAPTLRSVDLGPELLAWLEREAGETLPELLADALPAAGFDPATWHIHPAPATGVLEDGDAIGLGDRAFHVIHLAGHSPGQIALMEQSERLLFTGDAIYDGPLLDEHMDGTDIPAYVTSMRRLRGLEVDRVLPGHGIPFGRERLVELSDAYLTRRG